MKVSEIRNWYGVVPDCTITLCGSCKHEDKDFKKEPCASCEITKFEPKAKIR